MTKLRYTFFVLFFCLLVQGVWGQEYEGPLRSNTALTMRRTATSRVAARTTAGMPLPFFEDFTGAGIFPDSTKWADYQVYVNNTMCVRPVTRGAATFDALNTKGLPYNPLSNTAFGYADSMTTKAIDLDLSSSSPGDSIYLSFFYQPQGNGFYPLVQDSLILYFKTKFGGFVKVWSVPGSRLAPFRQVMIPITDSVYFHNDFQFRFVNIAALYWADAIWNVDYIRMDKSRSITDTAISDIGFTVDPGFLLNDYTSMPYRQFMASPSSERTLAFRDSVRNTYNTPQPSGYGYQATSQTTGAVLRPPSLAPISFPARSITGLSFPSYTATVPFSSVGIYDRLVFEHKFYIEQSTATGPVGNDTVVREQVFDNYLAYDDGTAEKSYYLNLYPTLPGKIAIEYHLNVPDTLQGLAIYFGRQIPYASYKAFSMVVYSALEGVNGAAADNLLFQQDLNAPGYADTTNHFWVYKFDQPLPLPAGTFYAGTIQPAESGSDSLYIGLDVNRVGTNHAYYKLLSNWNNSLISGALMIRPLLGQPVTGSSTNHLVAVKNDWDFSPNPAIGNITFTYPGDRVADYHITDMVGNTVQQGRVPRGKVLDVSGLAQGTYLLHLDRSDKLALPKKLLKL